MSARALTPVMRSFSVLVLFLTLFNRCALAQDPLKITLKGGNPTILECPAPYQEPGADITGGVAPYDLDITGHVGHEPGTYYVKYLATDSAGNTAKATRKVVVQDTTPPEVDIRVGKDLLWPPNHNLINVGLRGRIHDACDEAPEVKIMVFGNEDDEEETGDGHFSPDAKNIDFGSLRLRSERKGNGNGRVYMIVVTATDASGNTGFDAVVVGVPHDKSQKAMTALDKLARAIYSRRAGFVRYMLDKGGLPSGYFVIGDGEQIGPKQ